MKNSKLKVLAGVFFIVFALLPPNVSAATHKVWAGVTDTVAFTGQNPPTAVVSEVPDSYILRIGPSDTIVFNINWTADDQDTNPYSLGSIHVHTLIVDPSDADLTNETIIKDLTNSKETGAITITYPSITSDTTYDVTVHCKVQDTDLGQIESDSDSFTLTADVPPWI